MEGEGRKVEESLLVRCRVALRGPMDFYFVMLLLSNFAMCTMGGIPPGAKPRMSHPLLGGFEGVGGWRDAFVIYLVLRGGIR